MQGISLFWVLVLCELITTGIVSAFWFIHAGNFEYALLCAVPVVALAAGTYSLFWYANELRKINWERKAKPGVMIFLFLVEAGLADGLLYSAFRLPHVFITASGVFQGALWTLLFLLLLHLAGMGISVGYHLCFTHKAFKCSQWVSDFFGVCGASLALAKYETWGPAHRTHHRSPDRREDVHSPHKPFEEGKYNFFVRGLWAHLMWMCFEVVVPQAYTMFSDPQIVRVVRWQKWLYVPMMMSGFVIPLWLGGLGAFFLFGCVRAGLVLNGMCAVNSLGHMIGAGKGAHDKSKNSRLVSLLTMWIGEGNHGWHHLEPDVILPGLGACTLSLFERLGIVYGVRYPKKF